MKNSKSNKIKFVFTKLICPASLLIGVFAAIPVLAQTAGSGGKNNPYSPSPARKTRDTQPIASSTPNKAIPGEVAFIMQAKNSSQQEEPRPTIAQQTFKPVKVSAMTSSARSDTYKVGVGDILFVNIKNAPRGSGYYSVKPDGTIDYPLAGENVFVAGQTPDAIRDILTTGITLFANPLVEVKVREYASHKVTVSGMVENPGEKSLQREAIPMFVIRADAVVSPKATTAIIKRAPLTKAETYELRDPKTDNVLLYPGNSIEFISDSSASSSGNYFIGGEIMSGGQKNLVPGITLFQAIVASGGTKGEPKKAVIRRKDNKGAVVNIEHDLKAIKKGKASDPVVNAGDIIEVRN